MASLLFSAIVPSATWTILRLLVVEPTETVLSPPSTLLAPSTTALFAVVVTPLPNTKVFAPRVCGVVALPMVILLPKP